ncbi:hypothetical protein B0H14DRAFT_2656710 [Mycena olivaceomarginata]|nr:hypothetical protein B0H14DRAFT_2656710 [Mycena olivaceomarginata]
MRPIGEAKVIPRAFSPYRALNQVPGTVWKTKQATTGSSSKNSGSSRIYRDLDVRTGIGSAEFNCKLGAASGEQTTALTTGINKLAAVACPVRGKHKVTVLGRNAICVGKNIEVKNGQLPVSAGIPAPTILDTIAGLESQVSPQMATISYIVQTGIWGAGGIPFPPSKSFDPPTPASCPFCYIVQLNIYLGELTSASVHPTPAQVTLDTRGMSSTSNHNSVQFSCTMIISTLSQIWLKYQHNY